MYFVYIDHKKKYISDNLSFDRVVSSSDVLTESLLESLKDDNSLLPIYNYPVYIIFIFITKSIYLFLRIVFLRFVFLRFVFLRFGFLLRIDCLGVCLLGFDVVFLGFDVVFLGFDGCLFRFRRRLFRFRCCLFQ